MSRKVILFFAGLGWLLGALLPGTPLHAQEAILGERYGAGVHAYFAQDYLNAYESLTAAILAGSTDPRAYYFRGLTYLQFGRPEDAALDFQKGAQLESRDVNKFYNVSRALERIQGSGRAALEKYRVDARMAALEDAEKLRKARYEEIRRQEGRVLQQQAEVVPPGAVEAAGKATGAENLDPFANPTAAGQAASPEAKQPAAEAQPPVEPAAEAPEKPAAEPSAMPGGAPAGDDPFAPKPAGKSTRATPAEADPFAGGAAKPAAASPPGKKAGGILGAMGRAIGKAATGGGKSAEPPAGPGAPPPKPEAEAAPAAEPVADPFAPPPGGKPAGAPAAKPADQDSFGQPAAPAAKPADQNATPEPPGGGQPAAAKPADANDPFAEQPAAPSAAGEKKPAPPPAAGDVQDPFAK